MKIATFNVNNVNKRLPNLITWLKSSKPDVVCLQELKAAQSDFPEAALREAGYSAEWVGQKTWNGVAILARNSEIVVTRRTLPGDADDDQSRYIEAAVDGVIVACIYAPNGNPQPGPKFDYKLTWLKRLNAHAGKLLKSGAPVVIAGDFNVVPTPADIYPTKSWDKDALVQPEGRELFAKLLKKGGPTRCASSIRKSRCIRSGRIGGTATSDAGLRIDHLLLSPGLRPRLEASGVDRKERGRTDPSDRSPAWIRLA